MLNFNNSKTASVKSREAGSKNIKSLIAIAAISVAGIFYSSCKEVCPPIDFKGTTSASDTVSVPYDASLSSQVRNVLLEDFTGVGCVNCPDAHSIAAGILSSHPAGNVVVVAEHDTLGLLTIPYPFGTHDFRTVEAKDIFAALGGSLSRPIGAVDRKYFSGETTIPVARQKWAGYVNQDLLITPPKVQMKIERSYNDATRVLKLGVILQYAETITSNLNMSVMLTESGLVEPQLGGPNGGSTGIDTFYVHNHVLRDMMTPSLGRAVSGNHTPGHATKFLFPDYNVPASWNADSVKIVSFITNADTLNVLQVVDENLK